MKFMTIDESKQWCHKRAIQVTASRFLTFGAGPSKSLLFPIPNKSSRVIAMAGCLVPTWTANDFRGALLWFREWGIWDDHSETTGMTTLKQMRHAAGENRPLEVVPAHLFEAGELWEMHAHLLLPLHFGWDAFLVPEPAECFFYISHDEVVSAVAKTSSVLDNLRAQLVVWDPKEDASWYSEVVRH
jgi:hypothetical protein